MPVGQLVLNTTYKTLKQKCRNVKMNLYKIIMMIMIIMIIITERKITQHWLTASYNPRNTSSV